MNTLFSLLLAIAALALDSYAVETRFWQQTDQSDFEKGSLTHLSLRSDGRLYLAPEFQPVFDPSTPYLWAMASDGKGNVYAGGGGTGNGKSKLFVIDSKGNGKALAEMDGLEIHSIVLDRAGQIYVATDPDGKIYKVSPQGKAELFFDPKAKYIWALAFNGQGDLFVATGDQGEIFRVAPDGRGSVFFKTGETHARSLVMSGQNLIVGTEPGGLIIRVSPDGKGFVLYQTPKREVTAVAIGKSGEIYVAAVGNRSTTPAAAAPPPVGPPPSPVPPPAGSTVMMRSIAAAPPALATPPTAITGGSELYRIEADGSPRKIWTNTSDIVYAISFDDSGRPLLATGNRGRIYRIDSPNLSTQLVDASPTQITSFAPGPGGRLYVATGNIGRIYELGGTTSTKGTFESDVLDAGAFTYWGRFSFRGSPQSVSVMTRSGNLNRPQENWSPWAPLQIEKDNGTAPCSRCLNGRVASPSARFLQYKIELAGSRQNPAPEIASVEVAYQSKNLPPLVEEVEVTPANYKFPSPSAPAASPLASPASITLPALGHKKSPPSTSLDLTSSQALTYAKGMVGARWAASDDDGDRLVYKIEIRGVGESAWKLLKDKVWDKYISWDSTAFPDGEYELRVTASDAPSNVPQEALSAGLVSDPFLIDNTPPQILNLKAANAGARIEVSWKAIDARSIIDHAEYSVDGGDWIVVEPKTRLSDSPEQEYVLVVDRVNSGEQTVAVRVTDANDNQAVDKIVTK